MFGLIKKDIDYILEVIESYKNIQKAVIFGSRAKGNYKNTSDIDIVLYGTKIENTVLEISGRLNDEGPLPFKVDVLDYSAINNPKLKDHIDRIGVQFFPS